MRDSEKIVKEREREREGDLHEKHFWWHRNIGPETPSSVPDPPRSSDHRSTASAYRTRYYLARWIGRRGEWKRPHCDDPATTPRLVVFPPPRDGRIAGNLHRSTRPTRDIRETEYFESAPSIRVCHSSIDKSMIRRRNLGESWLDELFSYNSKYRFENEVNSRSLNEDKRYYRFNGLC